jgi:hypothetical protein
MGFRGLGRFARSQIDSASMTSTLLDEITLSAEIAGNLFEGEYRTMNPRLLESCSQIPAHRDWRARGGQTRGPALDNTTYRRIENRWDTVKEGEMKDGRKGSVTLLATVRAFPLPTRDAKGKSLNASLCTARKGPGNDEAGSKSMRDMAVSLVAHRQLTRSSLKDF